MGFLSFAQDRVVVSLSLIHAFIKNNLIQIQNYLSANTLKMCNCGNFQG